MQRGRRARADTDDRPKLWDVVRRAFAEFLTVPTLIIIGFLLVWVGTYALDKSGADWFEPVRALLRTHLFKSAQSTGALLSTVASGVITVTSITISLLLVALQQAAGSMTSQVFDQFLRRRVNQIYFGFFVGLALFALVTLATVDPPFNPVIGATVALLLTFIALYLLILLLYTTINQMRPVVIVDAMHHQILTARRGQLSLVRKTRRSSCFDGPVRISIRSRQHGFVTHIDVEGIDAAARGVEGETEAVLLVSIGTFVAFHDVIAEVKAQGRDAAAAVGEAVVRAIHLERKRDIATDPAFGIEEIETIAWTSISSAKDNLTPGLLTIRSLRDVLARWSYEKTETPRSDAELPVVYTDNVLPQLLNTFESLAVASSESMQFQPFAEVLLTFAATFDRLAAEQQRRVEDVILRMLSAMGDHVLTAELDAALDAVVRTLTDAGRLQTAHAVRGARDTFARTIGRLNSRSTRVGDGGS